MTGGARVAAIGAAGVLLVAAMGGATGGQGFPKPTIQEGPIEIRGSVSVTNSPAVTVTNSPAVDARQSGRWSVGLDDQARVHLAMPSFVERDQTYDVRWSEADRWERYRVTGVLGDGWVLADAQSPGAAPGRQHLNLARAVAVVRVGK